MSKKNYSYYWPAVLLFLFIGGCAHIGLRTIPVQDSVLPSTNLEKDIVWEIINEITIENFNSIQE